MFKRLLQKFKIKKFYHTGLQNTLHFGCDTISYPIKNNFCEIICITFNNPALLKLQSSLIQKYIKGSYNFTIADNSTDLKYRKELALICKNENIGYISLPINPYKNGSQSHAAAINWVVRNYLTFKKPSYFGFIDHDIFPIESFEPSFHLNKQSVYGLLQQREPYWYLWAGFSFFKYGTFDIKQMDFMPGTLSGINLDTGGMNWKLIYSNLKRENLVFPLQTYKNLREGEIFQSDKMEIIGSWLHSFNGSYWMKVEKKEHLLEEYLQQYL